MRLVSAAFLISACAAMAQSISPPSPTALSSVERELAQQLLSAKRIYVESFGDDRISKTLQAMIVDAVATTKRLIVTENREKADLLLKGSALEKTTEEF